MATSMTRQKWKVYGELALLATGMFAIGTDSFVIAPLLPRIAGDLDVTLASSAQLITVYALSYALLSPITAILTTRWPRERVLVVGLSIFVVANICIFLAPSYLSALLARALTGLGAALFAPVASARAGSLVSPEQRGRALAIIMVGLGAATALGAPIGTLIGYFGNWRIVFLAVAVLAAPVIFGIGRSVQDDSIKLSWADCIRPFRDPPVIATLLTTFLVLSGLYVTYTYISAVFDRITGHTGTVMALLQSVWGVAGIAGVMMAGRLTDRFGSRVVVCSASLVVFLDFLILPWSSGHVASAIVAVIVWGVCGWGFTVPQQHRLIQYAPYSAPIALGLYAMTVYGGTSVSGVVGAISLRFMSAHQLPLIGAGLILFGLMLEVCAQRRLDNPAYAT